MTPRWHWLAERWPTLAGQIVALRDFTHSTKFCMWSLLT